MTPPFHPSRIFIDETVEKLPLTQKILKHFPATPAQILSDPKKFKRPVEMTWAKKGLLLTRFKADLPLKPFPAMAESSRRPHYSLNLISNCHLECTYCILQSYLSNNPLITITTNIEEILEKLDHQLENLSPDSVIGTGKIADSLALENLTGFSATLVSFFAKKNHGTLLELKTKSDQVDSLLNLDHLEKTVVSWSINPQAVVEREEYKTAGVAERLAAAKKCAEAGYKIGFHLDPMIVHENWKENYANLIEQIFDAISPDKIAWMSLGILRFPARQKKTIENRFPKNKKLFEGLQQTHLPFLTYPEALRKEMYQTVARSIKKWEPNMELYYCMESEIR